MNSNSGLTEVWADISAYTGDLTNKGCLDLSSAGVVGVIAQAEENKTGITHQQFDMAKSNGLKIASYIMCLPGVSVTSRLNILKGYNPQFLSLDVERPGLAAADVTRDLILCDQFRRKAGSTSIYSAKWFFQKQGWADRPMWTERWLWDSYPNGVKDATSSPPKYFPYGGWQDCRLRQYIVNTSIGEVHRIDLSVSNPFTKPLW